MRAIRFSAQLGYEIEPETLKAASALAPNLRRISSERIREELEKTLLSERPELLRTAWAAGITKEFIPEFDRCMETDQINPHHCYTVGEHILKGVSLVRRDKILRLTMFLHDIAKPACRTVDEEGIDHFRGHAEVGFGLSKSILQRLKYDNATIRKVTTLVKYHDTQIRLTEPAVRKAMVMTGTDLFPLLLEVKQADFLSQSTYMREEKQANYDALCAICERIIGRGDCLSLKELAVNGSDLIEAGVKPGREVGDILALMFEEVLNVPEHNNKEYLLGRFVTA
jgi:tRNA nucleotidyltransferase (CCA-adding enzyme)